MLQSEMYYLSNFLIRRYMDSNAVHRSYLKTSEAIDCCVILLSVAMHYTFGGIWLSLARPIEWVFAGGFIFLGIALIVLSKKELSKQNQRAEPGFVTSELVVTGIYAKSRNPIYLASVLFYIGAGFWFQSLWPVIFTPLGILGFHYWLIVPEESYLEGAFSEEFKDYMSRVGRWWSF